MDGNVNSLNVYYASTSKLYRFIEHYKLDLGTIGYKLAECVHVRLTNPIFIEPD